MSGFSAGQRRVIGKEERSAKDNSCGGEGELGADPQPFKLRLSKAAAFPKWPVIPVTASKRTRPGSGSPPRNDKHSENPWDFAAASSACRTSVNLHFLMR